MSNLSSLSSITTMLQTSNIIWQSVRLADELKINLEYDIHHSLLNIFVENTNKKNDISCCINIISNRSEECQIISHSTDNLVISPDIEQERQKEDEDDEPQICYELSTTYVYDIIDENEHIDHIDLSQTRIACSSLSSSSSSSSCFDEQTIDNDDGYSTHSLDDIEQQQPLAIPASKLIIPSFSSPHLSYYSEQYVSPVRRLIAQLTWLSPFKKTVHEMLLMNHLFD